MRAPTEKAAKRPALCRSCRRPPGTGNRGSPLCWHRAATQSSEPRSATPAPPPPRISPPPLGWALGRKALPRAGALRRARVLPSQPGSGLQPAGPSDTPPRPPPLPPLPAPARADPSPTGPLARPLRPAGIRRSSWPPAQRGAQSVPDSGGCGGGDPFRTGARARVGGWAEKVAGKEEKIC